jgi:hypothetical protein
MSAAAFARLLRRQIVLYARRARLDVAAAPVAAAFAEVDAFVRARPLDAIDRAKLSIPLYRCTARAPVVRSANSRPG